MSLAGIRRALAWALVALAALALLWTGAAWWPLPALLRAQIESRGSQALGRALSVGAVEIAPWRLAVTLSDLRVAAARAQSTPQLSVARVHLNVSLRSLWQLAPVVEAVEIDQPQLRLARSDQGYDIDDVIARLTAAPPADAKPPEPARFALFNVELRNGSISFDDRPVQRQHRVRELQISLPFLSNLPEDLTVRVEPQLSMLLDDGRVVLRGQSLPFAADRATELKLDLGDSDLSRWWAYLPAGLPWRPSGGRLDAQLGLRFAQPPKAVPQLAISGTLHVRDLAVANADGQPLVAWQTLALNLTDLRPFERVLALQSLRLDGVQLDVRRLANGQIDGVPPSSPAAATSSAPATPAAAPKPWAVTLQRLDVAASQLRWNDATTQPAAALAAQDLVLSLERVAWPGSQPAALQLAARLQAGRRAAGQLELKGEVSPASASIDADLTGLPLAAAQPYLQQALRVQAEGVAALKGHVEWRGGEKPQLAIADASVAIDRLRLTEAGSSEASVALAGLRVNGVQADLLDRRATVAQVLLRQPDLRLRRDGAGQLNVSTWSVAPAAAPTRSAEPSPPWSAELRSLSIDSGQLRLDDSQPNPGTPHRTQLRGIKLQAQNLHWPASAQPLRFELALNVPAAAADDVAAAEGTLDARGQLTLAPLALTTQLQLDHLPLQAFEPYWAATTPVKLARAELAWRGSVQATSTAAGWAVAARGAGQLADLRVRTRGASADSREGRGEALLSWQTLAFDGLNVALAPPARPRIDIAELRLSDFYSRLVITEQGRFNLRDVQGPAAAASAASAPAPAASSPGLPVDLVVARTQLANGSIDFRDRFVRPSYAAALTDLNGSIGRIASGTRDMAPIELRGRVAGTGLLEIRGALNPTAEPLALDLSARATDLELAPLTPYSGKYIGYAIERGKLSVDVAYRIDADGKLDARNQLVLNQLTLGPAIESAEATKLPVRLALALLTDRHGVIDINLPISGSINDPQFSVFGLVLKVLGNLLLKAVTSPFALLTGGGSEEMSVIEFVPGTARLADGGSAALERIAEALAQRPALRLTVQGSADAAGEAEAMRSARLEARLLQEQRREARATPAAASAPAPAASAPSGEQRQRLLERVYANTALPDKPRNFIGMAKTLPAAEMEARLRAAMTLGPDSARELALQRSVVVRDALISRGLASERLFLGAPELDTTAEAAAGPRARLSLASP